jgi:hypothetical protein
MKILPGGDLANASVSQVKPQVGVAPGSTKLSSPCALSRNSTIELALLGIKCRDTWSFESDYVSSARQ